MLKQNMAEEVVKVLTELQQVQVTSALYVEQLVRLLRPYLGDDEANGQSRPVVEQRTFSVIWKGQRCRLSHTILFALFCRLLRQVNHFVPHDYLLRDVWQAPRAPETIRSAIHNLKVKLVQAGMKELAGAIRVERKHCGLMLDDYARVEN